MQPITIKTQRQQKIKLIADYLVNKALNGEFDQADFTDVAPDIANDIINLIEEGD
jgi:hypothetical protein